MNCAFTICAKNYIGLAKVLEKSFLEHNPEARFFIFISDVPDSDTPKLDENIIIAKDELNIVEQSWIDQAFKYNLTEFCTAIKPKCFEWLFEKQHIDKAIYLDPDIFCYSDFKTIFGSLNEYSIVLSPHITTIQPEEYTGDLFENIFLWSGTFNLGFLALRRDENSRKLIVWWNRKLEDECYFDNSRFTATDQKWQVYTSMFFDQSVVRIDRDLGIDAAPWNFFEREFYTKDNGEIWVKNRVDKDQKETKLKFVHFSNYKYSELCQGVVNHYTLKYEYLDLNTIFKPYVSELEKCEMSKYLPLKYSYNTFDNGQVISALNRRFYRRLTLDNVVIENPFSTQAGSYYEMLRRRKLLTKGSAVTTSVRGVKNSDVDVPRVVKLFDLMCRLAKRVMGVDRYEHFIRFAATRLIPENQTHLYDNKSRKNL